MMLSSSESVKSRARLLFVPVSLVMGAGWWGMAAVAGHPFLGVWALVVAIFGGLYAMRSVIRSTATNVYIAGDCLFYELGGVREYVKKDDIVDIPWYLGNNGMGVVSVSLKNGKSIEFLPRGGKKSAARKELIAWKNS